MGIMKSVTKGLNRIKYKTVKNAPTILFVAGLVLDGVALYSFIKKSGRLTKIVEEHNKKIDELHKKTDISEKEANKEVCNVYKETVVEVAKEVAVPGTLWIGSKVCYFYCKKTLDARYLGAVGLYKAVQTNFNKYRQRNIELHGAEADADCMYGKTTDIVHMAPEDEGGEVTKTTMRFPENAIDDACTIWFDEGSDFYTRSRITNEWNVNQQERFLNNTFAEKEWIRLQDIIECLGLADDPRYCTPERIMIQNNLGRVWDSRKTDVENYISFGVDDPINADKNNSVLTLCIDHLDILENVMPKKGTLGSRNK